MQEFLPIVVVLGGMFLFSSAGVAVILRALHLKKKNPS